MSWMHGLCGHLLFWFMYEQRHKVQKGPAEAEYRSERVVNNKSASHVTALKQLSQSQRGMTAQRI